MNILISNDDGIDAQGIHTLADAIAQLEDVNIYVVAPDTQRSCCGHALTLNNSVRIKAMIPTGFNEKVKWAYSCSGVPADCIRIGLYLLREAGTPADLVCTGINHGSNWGSDIFYSGTLAAAREASVCFTQSIAFSLCNEDAVHFEHFKEVVPAVIKKAYKKLPYTTVLNVNIPDLPAEEIKGTKVCKQGPMDYGLGYKTTINADGSIDLKFDGGVENNNKADENWDSVCGNDGYVTLTPCDLFPYNESSLQSIRDLGIKFYE